MTYVSIYFSAWDFATVSLPMEKSPREYLLSRERLPGLFRCIGRITPKEAARAHPSA